MTPQGPAIFVSIRIRLSDDGAHAKFFCGGAFTTDFLSWLVRDEQKVTLEEWRATVSPPSRFIGTGYTYLVRSEGKEFLTGNYHLKFQATLLDGTAVTYQGMIPVVDALPRVPPTASISASKKPILDTRGDPVVLTF